MSIITAADRALTNDYDVMEELKVRRRDGSLLRMKAGLILEEVGLVDSVRALNSDKVSQTDKERVKANLMKIAGIDNPMLSGAGAGQGFSIVINVGSGAQAPVAEASAPRNVTPPSTAGSARAGAAGGVSLTLPFNRSFPDAHLTNCDLSAGVED